MPRTNHPSPCGTSPCSVFSNLDSGTMNANPAIAAVWWRNTSARRLGFARATELHVVLACRGVEPLDFRLLNGKRFHVLEPRRVSEVPEEPLEARRHEDVEP